MANDPETNYLNWLGKAEEDELSIQAILKGGGAFSTACFLSQQMTEKYLKGFLVFSGRSFPKIHDLLELETLLLENLPDVVSLHEELKHLNRYYIETRYPGDYPEITSDEAQKALGAAQRIKDFVLQAIEKKR